MAYGLVTLNFVAVDIPRRRAEFPPSQVTGTENLPNSPSCHRERGGGLLDGQVREIRIGCTHARILSVAAVESNREIPPHRPTRNTVATERETRPPRGANNPGASTGDQTPERNRSDARAVSEGPPGWEGSRTGQSGSLCALRNHPAQIATCAKRKTISRIPNRIGVWLLTG